jgi:long-chain acyl-CoA synthetase
MMLSVNNDIEQTCVVGTALPQPIAIIVLTHLGKAKSKEDLMSSLNLTLDIVNPKLDNHEKIHNFIVVSDEWTVENKLLTPTMKIKRNEIESIYKHKYLAWYDGKRICFD